jgi:predicted nucleic acid-binding protein
VSGFLLDTNVISELVRPKPHPQVAAWIESIDETLLFLSVLTLGEIRKGIDSIQNSPRRVLLESWLGSELSLRFAGRILLIDHAIANRWGNIAAKAAVAKIQLPVIDGLLAATAIHHNLTLVTRNVKDFVPAGVPLFDPWMP